MIRLLAMVLVAFATHAAAFERTEEREACAEYDPLRRPFFGDTHVHTALSFDAAGQGTRARPRDAYRFARGEKLGIQPYDAEGRPSEYLKLDQPLDYAMVSDHSDLLGETHICTTPGAPGHDSWMCTLFNRWPKLGYAIINSRYGMERPQRMRFCGENGRICLEQAVGPWQEIQDAAEEAYDRSSSCEFTSFVGYEWTAMPGDANLHRNVVFRNRKVQQRPTSFTETPEPEAMWRALESECLERGDGCDVIAIPHNSNVSGGLMFSLQGSDGEPIKREDAERRARLERLVEVTQHKGDSECLPTGLTTDELCNFEQLGFSKMSEQGTPWKTEPTASGYVRESLAQGLREWRRLGVNPFGFGLIGATDTHLATPGLVDEKTFPGHAAGTVSRRLEIPPLPDRTFFNPGGLSGLWAEENSRDSLFEAMRRREAYGTSGPRLIVRNFAGWELPEDLCDRDDLVEQGYAGGVPMGGELPVAPYADARPRIVVRALSDPGTRTRPVVDLERIQIVKAWTENGESRARVFDVAGTPVPENTVDLANCSVPRTGIRELCATWTDPDFDAASPALYYVRVLEVPTCRWLQWACLARGVDCRESSTHGPGLDACCAEDADLVLRERAWTSPIWYLPRAAESAR